MIKKEVLADEFQLRFEVENIPSPTQFIFYMLNNYFTMRFKTTDCHLPSQDHKQLESFMTLLEEYNIITLKKRKLPKTAPPIDAELVQTATQSLKDYI